MEWADEALDALEQADIELVAYLPDTKLMPLIDAAEDRDRFETVLVTREEEGVGVVAGAWLGGKRGALLCQSSGLANTFNAIASLAIPARIPFLTITTRRGDLGEFNLAQVPAGYGMPGLLDELGVRNHCIDDLEHVDDRVRMAAETAFATETPYAVLLESTVTGYKEENQ
ncbi:thiamine pyrophosphate-binding protein [Halorussus salinisoli]|uniref:thiamine pyrophosphate-binding protein n=1 Tax=Halorussus salinisoli TaxID=2558242 RepID=UPI0014858228|nr:thiamine pyrophosphate-binding protein [Halorussus salinisoli]